MKLHRDTRSQLKLLAYETTLYSEEEIVEGIHTFFFNSFMGSINTFEANFQPLYWNGTFKSRKT